ncbi:MAG TPA: histidine kinase [Cyanobacteria bacterium UBA8553]|nr:histidine kinase [Cyanobacteria bacterium UBA8553]
MLCQRTAMFSLQLLHTQDRAKREQICTCLLDAIELMEKSHNGLIYGDASMNLPGKPSNVVKQMYFKSPVNLDQQLRRYVAAIRALVQTPEAELVIDNLHLKYILKAASTDLLSGLDAIVSQYQKESETEQLLLDVHKNKLYEQACASAAIAQSQAQQLEKTLHDLKNTQSQLIQSEKIAGLGQLVAGVAHDINNPVSFIYGNLNEAIAYTQDLLALVHLYQTHYPNPNPEIHNLIESIDLDFLIEDLPEVLSSMKIGAEQIYQIALNLRNFSRQEEAHMKPVQIHEGLDTTLLILKSRLNGGGRYPRIQVVKEYGDLPPVEGYAGQLNQVFMNILSNAIEAHHESNSKLSAAEIENQPPQQIKIRTEASRLDTITITISDNGSGMTEEVKARLFEPFFTTKPVGKGTGLGLSISYQIVVEKHNGSLRCESELGKGTEFSIEIPIYQHKASFVHSVSPISSTVKRKIIPS